MDTYVVQENDGGFWQIARKLGVDYSALVRANPGKDPARTWKGLVLNVPPRQDGPKPKPPPRVRYTVPGEKRVFKQATDTCWAATYGIMVTWKKPGTFKSLQDALTPLGDKWVQRWKNHQGVSAAEGDEFVKATGLVKEPANLDIAGWEGMLRQYGLLWVSGKDKDGGVHDRVVEGIIGDGTPRGTFLQILDSDDDSADEYTESVQRFTEWRERLVKGQSTSRFNSDYNLLHF